MTSLKNLAVEFKKITDELFVSNGFECRKLYYGKKVYYCVRDIFKCLGYTEDRGTVNKMLNKLRNEDKFLIKDLEKRNKTDRASQTRSDFNINKELIDSLNKYEKDFTFVNKDLQTQWKYFFEILLKNNKKT